MEFDGVSNQCFIFSGSSCRDLASDICGNLGLKLGRSEVSRFSDGEINVEIKENVSNIDVFVVQSTSFPVNDNLLELLLMVDALKRSSAKSITAIVPYYGYSRQDRKVASGSPISAKLVANLLESSGVTRLVTMDFHASQIQGFFNIQVDNLSANSVIYKYLKMQFAKDEVVVVSPDAGGIKRSSLLSRFLGCSLAVVDKFRPVPNKVNVTGVMGDVNKKIVIIQDDMVDTAGTLIETAKVLEKNGAGSINVYCTHPVLSGVAVERILESPIKTLTVTDTIPLNARGLVCDKIRVLSISMLLSEAIRRICTGASLTSLFV